MAPVSAPVGTTTKVEEALAEIRVGGTVVVVDSRAGYSCGVLVTAAEQATSRSINFMAIEGRGLICVALDPARLRQLRADWRDEAGDPLRATALLATTHAELHKLTEAGIIERRQTSAAPAYSGKGRFPLGAPFSAPAFQQFRAQLVFPRNFTGGRAGVQGAHGGDFEIATVNRSGQIDSSLH